MEAIRRPKGALLTAVRGTIWEMRALIVGATPLIDTHKRPLLIEWASAAKAELKQLKDQGNSNAKVTYERWVDDQLRLGAGALHAFTKRVAPPIEEAAYIHRAKSPDTIRREKGIAREKRESAERRSGVRKCGDRPCHLCPANERYDGDFCGDCGNEYGAVRSCRTCKTNGLTSMRCSDCGQPTKLAFKPMAERCACGSPPSKGAWCTDCGGMTYNAASIRDEFFDEGVDAEVGLLPKMGNSTTRSFAAVVSCTVYK